MTTKPSRLRAVPRLVGKTGFEYRFDVASQVMAAGTQDVLCPDDRPAVRSGQGPDRCEGRQAVGLRRQQGSSAVFPGCMGTGLEGLRFHDLRHYYASLLIRHGNPSRRFRRVWGTPMQPRRWTPTAICGRTLMIALVRP